MASSSSATWKYDVFLSFRGIDTRHGFTSYLYQALRLAKINTFIDKKLEKGEEISGALLQEIESSSIFMVIFSQNYAFSSYCLDELVKIIECKKSIGRSVFPVFYKVDPTDIEELRGSYEKAFAKHEAKYKEDKDKMGKWKSALREAINLSGWHITDDKEAPKCINRIVKKIKKKLIEEKKEKLKRKPQEVQENVEALQTKRLVSQEFQSDKDTGRALSEPTLLQQSSLNMSIVSGDDTVSHSGIENANLTWRNSTQKPFGEDLPNASGIVKIIKPIVFSSSVLDHVQYVLVTFLAMRSDGRQVIVDISFLKANYPLLLIDYYEQHLRRSAQGQGDFEGKLCLQIYN